MDRTWCISFCPPMKIARHNLSPFIFTLSIFFVSVFPSLWLYYVTMDELHLFLFFFFPFNNRISWTFLIQSCKFHFVSQAILFYIQYTSTLKTHAQASKVFDTMDQIHWILMDGNPFFLLFVLSKIRCLFNALIHIELKYPLPWNFSVFFVFVGALFPFSRSHS